jgi:hypothetical protein
MAHPRYFFFWRFSFPPSFTSTPFTATGSDSLETAIFPGLRRGRRRRRVLGLGGPFRLPLPWKRTLASVSYPGGQGPENRFAAKIFWNWDLAAARRFVRQTEVSPAERTHVRGRSWNRDAFNIADSSRDFFLLRTLRARLCDMPPHSAVLRLPLQAYLPPLSTSTRWCCRNSCSDSSFHSAS